MTGCRISKVTDKNTGRQLIILPSNNFKKNTTTDWLEEALLWARSGKIVAVGIVAVNGDGTVMTTYCDGVKDNFVHALAGVSTLQYTMQKDADP